MIRIRFEKASQIFEFKGIIILPLSEITPERAAEYKKRLYAELPPLVWEGSLPALKEKLAELKSMGIYDVVAENVGAIAIAKEFGFTIHGGFTLNILNSEALKQYAQIGLADAVLSAELSFAHARKIKADIPFGMIVYGQLPMMKLRACPAKGEKGCGACTGRQTLIDRKGESFELLCRGKQYSELLNCVPIYVGDKSVPRMAFEELYFTIEEPAECERIYKLYIDRAAPDFRRTAGLYFRELL